MFNCSSCILPLRRRFMSSTTTGEVEPRHRQPHATALARWTTMAGSWSPLCSLSMRCILMWTKEGNFSKKVKEIRLWTEILGVRAHTFGSLDPIKVLSPHRGHDQPYMSFFGKIDYFPNLVHAYAMSNTSVVLFINIGKREYFVLRVTLAFMRDASRSCLHVALYPNINN
jgi:hypothetical protein